MPPVPKKKSKRGLHLRKPVDDNAIIEDRQSPIAIEPVVDNEAAEDMSSIMKPVDVNTTIQDRQSPIVTEDLRPQKVYWPETEESLPDLEIEVVRLPGTYDSNLKNITGKRIVDISHLIGEIRALEKHECHVKRTGYLAFEKEIVYGLNSKLYFKCPECKEQKHISTNPGEDTANINLLATWSIIGTGQGYSSFEESLSLLDIPPLDKKTFLKYQQELGNTWHECLTESILEAGKEEYQIAADSGNLTTNKIGQCSVIVDGGWSHRSYGHKYTAKSGVACIIGACTKKLLFVGMRNKYCSICSVAAQKHIKVPSHTCYKNWSGSSPAMEADIILEGFLQSESMHKLHYTTFIGDGDSSVHSKILENVPYCRKIKKIECANHLTKNLTKHLHQLAKESTACRKLLPATRINHIGKTCRKLIAIHSKKKNPSAEDLKSDIQNVVEHVFGNHQNCNIECCLKHGQVNTQNILRQAPTETRLRIFRILGNFASHAPNLIKNLTSNRCEQFMRQVAKFNKGKQTFYGRRNSFNIRCNAASLAYQFGPSWFLKVYRRKFNKTPSKSLKRLVNKRLKKNANVKKCRRRLFTAEDQKSNGKKDYGKHCQKPDLHEEEIKKLIDQQVRLLDVSFGEADEIERSTRGQTNNPKWFEERESRLTASTFGDICKRRLYFGKLVETIMYKKLPSTIPLEWGRINEDVAREAYTLSTKNIVTPCGLFVCTDEGYGFLGASPDGLVGDDKIIEIKCPYSAREYTPLEAAKAIKSFCCSLTEDGCDMNLKKNHRYYFQVQGQLYIAKKKYCDFVIWTPKGLHIQTIEYNEEFTKTMVNKLHTFFYNHYGVELVDSRRSRNMEIRSYSK